MAGTCSHLPLSLPPPPSSLSLLLILLSPAPLSHPLLSFSPGCNQYLDSTWGGIIGTLHKHSYRGEAIRIESALIRANKYEEEAEIQEVQLPVDVELGDAVLMPTCSLSKNPFVWSELSSMFFVSHKQGLCLPDCLQILPLQYKCQRI